MAKMHLVPIRRGYWGSVDSVRKTFCRLASTSTHPYSARDAAERRRANARRSPVDSTQEKFRPPSHDSYEVKRHVRLGLCETHPGAARHRSRRRSGL